MTSFTKPEVHNIAVSGQIRSCSTNAAREGLSHGHRKNLVKFGHEISDIIL